MPYSAVINTRSPYYTVRPVSAAATVEMRLFIWDGHVSNDFPTNNPAYILSKEVEQNGKAVFEISELIRDYILTEYLTESTDAVFVQWTTTINNSTPTASSVHIAIDGYGYFEEGINPRNTDNPTTLDGSYTPQVLQDARKVYFIPGEDIRIPVWGDAGSEANIGIGSAYWDVVTSLWEDYNVLWNTNIQITPGDNSEDKIQYIVISGTDLLGEITNITITSTDGLQVDNIDLIRICEPKFTPIRISFYNKYGAMEDIWASKKSSKSLKASSSSYKRSILKEGISQSVTYSTTQHTDRRFDVAARESITVNTDLYTEDINEAISQLLMSEQVWLTEEGQILPVILKTDNVEKKTSVKDKMVQYTLDFEYAFDKIQSIR
jgi:hypothetical protein